MTRSLGVLSTAALASSLALAPSLLAQQIPFSQHGEVAQRVGFTDVAITYNRPVARGRELFGGVVDWGRIWNPGADSATTISFSRAVTVDGHALEAGRYTIWMVPTESVPWTVIFSRAVDIFHTPYPGEEHDAARFTVRPERGAHMEALAFYFPAVVQDSTVLRMHWGETIVPIGIAAPWRPPPPE
jgi:hypothetical protein